MGKKIKVKRNLFTLTLILLLVFSSFLTGFIVNKVIISRIEEKLLIVSYINFNSLVQEEYPECQR